MSRRPDNWVNPNKAKYTVLGLDGTISTEPATERGKREHNIYEAGADAILEALKGEGAIVTVSQTGVLHILPGSLKYPLALITKGVLVFIPEETG